jgi:hypothetical protein
MDQRYWRLANARSMGVSGGRRMRPVRSHGHPNEFRMRTGISIANFSAGTSLMAGITRRII